MKFKINLSPVRSDDTAPVLSVNGASITINSQEFDFGFLNAGDTLPKSAIMSEHFCGDVSRTGDTVEVTIRLPHGPDAPESIRFPQPILVEQDGPITLPGEDDAN